MTIGERIKKQRNEKGLSQAELGALMGVSGSAIGQFETSSNPPKLGTLKKIADALGVPTSDLMDTDMGVTYEERIKNTALTIRELLNVQKALDISKGLYTVYVKTINKAIELVSYTLDSEIVEIKECTSVIKGLIEIKDAVSTELHGDIDTAILEIVIMIESVTEEEEREE